MSEELIILTEEERRRFADYCRQEAETHAKLKRQMGHLPGVFSGREEAKAAAFVIVSREIDPEAWESVEVAR